MVTRIVHLGYGTYGGLSKRSALFVQGVHLAGKTIMSYVSWFLDLLDWKYTTCVFSNVFFLTRDSELAPT